MGCQIFKDAHEFTEENELNYSQLTKEKLINLDKGGSIISTRIGNIQYGMPPETVKDSLNQGIQVPEYYIIPSQTFDWAKGINLMEFEFPVYFNFFVRKKTKTKLICDDQTRKQIEIIFQETLLGPKQFQNFDQEFSDDYKAQPDLEKELKHFAVNPFEPTMPLKINMFLEFLIFDDKDQVTINKTITEDNKQKNCSIKIQKKNNLFLVFQDNEFLQKFHDKVQIHQKKFSVYSKVSKTELYNNNVQFIPPAFGFTMLGSSHGFDACGSTSGFILWVNKKGIMIDPPPFSSQALRKNGIPPNLIEKIIITHCHADHDAGIFQKIIEATQLEFITTPTIINSFLRKYSAISNIKTKELKKLFQYRSVKIGHPTLICGARFLFSYAFHSIPCLRFEVQFQGKKFFFSSDTFYNPEALKKIYQKGVFSKERYLSLANIDFSQYDAILHEAGVPPIHTPTSVLQNLPQSVRKNLYLYHIAEKDVAEGLKRALVGLDNTVVIIKENKNRNKIVENLDLLCSVELIHWVPFNRIIEIIEIFEEKYYEADEVIIQEGTVGSKFYIVKEGEVVIYCNDPSNYFQKSSFRGDYFGESALIGNGQRLATVKAVKPTVLLEIESQDFLWTFNYDTEDHPKYSLSPIKMIKNLSDIRQKKNSEFINYNKIIEKMTEAQKCMINMFLKEKKVCKNQYLWQNGGNPQFCLFAFEGDLELKIPLSKLPNDSQIEKGTLIGDFPFLINNQKCQSSLKCLTNGTVYILEIKYLKEFLLQYPGIQILLQDSYLFK